MKRILVSIKDSQIEGFFPVICVEHENQAVRSFVQEINRPGESNLYLFPEDFDLYKIGTFDDTTGQLENLPSPLLLRRGRDSKRPVS